MGEINKLISDLQSYHVIQFLIYIILMPNLIFFFNTYYSYAQSNFLLYFL